MCYMVCFCQSLVSARAASLVAQEFWVVLESRTSRNNVEFFGTMMDPWGSLQKQETAQFEELLVNQFGIKPADVQFVIDVRSGRVVGATDGRLRRHHSPASMSSVKCLPPEVRTWCLDDVDDMVFSVETVGSYAEETVVADRTLRDAARADVQTRR